MPRLTSFLELTWDEEKRMEEQIRNLNRRESMSIRCGERMRARRRFRAGLLDCCLGMFLAILLGLAAVLITPAGPTLASITTTPPMPSAQQGTRGANTTKGTNP